MKSNFLFPNIFKKIGWILLIPATILGFMVIFYDFEFSFLSTKVLSLFPDTIFAGSSTNNPAQHTWWKIIDNNITNELSAIIFIVAAIFVAFSKEKNEDEYISKTRLDSLMWATYANYAVLIFCFLFFYEFRFLTVIALSMFSILIFFILRFNFILYKTKLQNNEK